MSKKPITITEAVKLYSRPMPGTTEPRIEVGYRIRFDDEPEPLLLRQWLTDGELISSDLTNLEMTVVYDRANYMYQEHADMFVGQNFCGTGLTDAERERLTKLLEELGEVQQVIGKTLLHGYESGAQWGGKTNRQRLIEELGDVHWIQGLMTSAGEITDEAIENAAVAKMVKFRETGCFLHYQDNDTGTTESDT